MEHFAKIVTLPDGSLCINVPVQSGVDKILLTDIVYLKGESSQAGFHLASGKTVIVSLSLMHWATPLLAHGFLRIHDSYVISLLHYKHYQKGDPGYVVMTDGTHINVTATYRKDFMKALFDEADDTEPPASAIPPAA
jgi:two-component system LytT family response regulator